MPTRNLYIFIGENFGSDPGVSREVLDSSLVTSFNLAKVRAREGLVKVIFLAQVQTIAVVWAIDAWVMLLIAIALTVKQLKTIRKLNVDVAAYVFYREMRQEKVLNYGRPTDNFAGQATFRTIY